MKKYYKEREIIDQSVRKTIKTKKIPELVFLPLKNKGYFTFYKYNENSKCYHVEKNSTNMNKISKEIIDDTITSLQKIKTPKNYTEKDTDIIQNKNTINPLKKRLIYTSCLIEFLYNCDMVKEIISKESKNTNEFLKSYNNKMNFPLFGIVRGVKNGDNLLWTETQEESQKNNNVLYLLSYFDTKDQSTLKNMYIDLDNLFISFLQKETPLKKILKESGTTICRIHKIVSKPRDSDGICVIFFLTFYDDIKQMYTLLKIKKIQNYLEKQLNWQVYRSKDKEALTIPLR